MITTQGAPLGVYLHWNGGRDSVEAFLRWAELAELPPLRKDGRGFTAFAAVLCNFFGNDGNTVEIEAIDPRNLTQHVTEDNGIYLVEGWEIVGRLGAPTFEQNSYKLETMLAEIDKGQGVGDQLGAYLLAQDVPTESLSVGDRVWGRAAWNAPTRFQEYTVLGFGENRMINGTNVLCKPYIDRFDNDGNAQNINSYIRTDTARVTVN